MTAMSNVTALGADQVELIRGYHRDIRQNTMNMAKLAYEIHSEHISKDGRKYDAPFEKWWKENDVGALFGTRSNWTHWHQAGLVISKVEKRFSRNFNQLPMTVRALKEIAELTDEEMGLCLQNTYARTSLSQPEGTWTRPKKPKPLINTSVSAAKINAWREAWRNPKPKVKSDPRRLVLATIKIHGSFFDFDKRTALPSGLLDKEAVRKFSKKLNDVFGSEEKFVLVENHAEKLCSQHNTRQERANNTLTKRSAKKKRSNVYAKKK